MKTDLDDLPSYESKKMNRTKYNQNRDVSRSRIDRWLRSRLNQSFESVFSEWTKLSWLPARLRNLDYFKYFVETEFSVKENGELMAYSYGWARSLNNEFYIHPDSHKLLFAERRKRVSYKTQQKEKMDKIHRFISDYEQLCKIDGIWYYVELNSSFETVFYDYVKKEMFTRTVKIAKKTNYFSICKYEAKDFIKKKEQLDTKALRRYNLKND